jgi:hypothetical protein
MLRAALVVLLSPLLIPAAFPQSSPFVGRWDFNVTTPHGNAANWLGITKKGDGLNIWFQPTGGHVHPVANYTVTGSHLTMTVADAAIYHPATIWELDAKNGKLTGRQKLGWTTIELTGVRAPELKRSAPKAWTKPEPLFDGKDLKGWTPIGNVAQNHWVVKDGLLVNEKHGANLESTQKFTDFKLHFEVNCPEDANSGFYLRGRYELQLEYEPVGTEPPERGMGSIYGRIAPSSQLPRKPGQWESFDVTLAGRTVTVVRNGTETIDHREIDGITGGALDANEGESGAFYIQGDHTGGLKFRNITVSVPQS